MRKVTSFIRDGLLFSRVLFGAFCSLFGFIHFYKINEELRIRLHFHFLDLIFLVPIGLGIIFFIFSIKKNKTTFRSNLFSIILGFVGTSIFLYYLEPINIWVCG